MIAAIIWDKVKIFEEIVILCLQAIQLIKMDADVCRFEVSVDDILSTDIILRVENLPDYFLGILLRQQVLSMIH